MAVQRVVYEVILRVRWMSVIVALLCTAAIIWTLISPMAWTSSLILIGAAIALAILGKDAP